MPLRPMPVLCLEVHRIDETPREFRLVTDAPWWERARQALGEPEVEVRRSITVSLRAHRIGLRLLCQGTVDGVVDMICGRCLEPYPFELTEPLELLLEPAPAHSGLPEGTIAMDPDDPGVGRYTGDPLDLSPAVVEVLSLAWPVQPRCTESCKGLCPTCGTNRNQAPCRCAVDTTTRPFAGLREMLARGSGSGARRRS